MIICNEINSEFGYLNKSLGALYSTDHFVADSLVLLLGPSALRKQELNDAVDLFFALFLTLDKGGLRSLFVSKRVHGDETLSLEASKSSFEGIL
jgi:hypothetical protein